MTNFIVVLGGAYEGGGTMMRRASCWGWTVSVAEHWMEGTGKGVGESAPVVVLRKGHQAGKHQQQQEEHVQGEGGTQHPLEEGARRRLVTCLPPGGQEQKGMKDFHKYPSIF